MSLSRRELLALAAAAGAAPLLGRGPTDGKPKSLRILVLGGTGFLGPSTIEVALARGHKVAMFNRGRTRPDLFPGVEKLHGDRDPKKDEGLKALEQGDWDVVIDNSGYYPRMVGASAALLAPRAKRYIYISSISAYKDNDREGLDETAPVATMADPTLENMGKQFEHYGALKALCEQAAEKAMPGRTCVVRPGFIVGPDDPTGRFTYWPVRFDKGGEVAVPGAPEDPVQVIDVRDLGAWLVKLAEDGTVGAFNACGPEKRMPWGRVVEACRKAAGQPATPVWIPAAFLKAREQQEGFPIWAPFEGETKGFHTWSNARAIKAGLRFRPVEATVADTLAWYKTQLKVEKGRVRLAGPEAEKEAKLVADWKAAQLKARQG